MYSQIPAEGDADLKQIDHQVFPQKKMGLFGISRELQFRICNYGKPCASLHTVGKGECFIGRKRELGRL